MMTDLKTRLAGWNEFDRTRTASSPWSAYWHDAVRLFCEDVAKILKDLVNREAGSRAKIITDNRSISFEAEIIPGETSVIYLSVFPDMGSRERIVMRCQPHFRGQGNQPSQDISAYFLSSDSPSDIAKVLMPKLHKWMGTL